MNLLPPITAEGKLTDAGLIEIDAEAVRSVRQYYADAKLLITVKKFSGKRSIQQNRWYRGCVLPALKEALTKLWGEEPTNEEVHELLRQKFLSKEVSDPETGQVMLIPKSTASLTKEEFFVFVEKVRKWASEFLYINIPDPISQLTEPQDATN
jgi:hypothetical protein